MRSDARIPIVVGVTGHRNLRPEDLPALTETVRLELSRLTEAYPHTPVQLLTSLAEGADQLCAAAAESLGIPVIAALPMERVACREDFSGAALAAFEAFCDRAAALFTTPFAERAPETVTRDFCYRQAGIYVAGHCHVLLALWDGGAPEQGGCGTAETVDFMLHNAYLPHESMALRPDGDGAVLHILAPRAGAPAPAEPAGIVRFFGQQAQFSEILHKTEDFNCNAASFDGAGHALFAPPDAPDAVTARLDGVYALADALSGAYAKTYRRVLAVLAAIGTSITLGFLLYDELELPWMLLLCGLLLLCALLAYRYAGRSACHSRYLEYRALAETLRVQAYLRYAGTDLQAADLLTWTQRTESVWVKEAAAALCLAGRPEDRRSIRTCWIEAQRDYHRRAQGRTGIQLHRSERIMQTALACSVAAYGIALLFELLLGGILSTGLDCPPQAAALFRTVLKIVVGTLSACTLFVASYYGELSLTRKASDHEKMTLLYDKALSHLDAYGQTEQLLSELAREELIENGNWCSYQRDNKPTINL